MSVVTVLGILVVDINMMMKINSDGLDENNDLCIV